MYLELLKSVLGDVEQLAAELLFSGLIFYFIEAVRPLSPQNSLNKHNLITDAAMACLNIAITAPVVFYLVVLPLAHELDGVRLSHFFSIQIESLPFWAQVCLATLAMDLGTYWRHRLTHRYAWPYHSIHHSPDHVTWSTGFRLHPIDALISLVFGMLSLYILGFDGSSVIIASYITHVFNTFIHINVDLDFKGLMRYLLASPNYHKWHHATDPAARDKNFVAVFPFFDLLFGSYYYPKDRKPEHFGLYTPSELSTSKAGLFSQLVYPFRRHWQVVQRWLRTTPDTL